MIFYDYYSDIPDADLRDFVSRQHGLGDFIHQLTVTGL